MYEIKTEEFYEDFSNSSTKSKYYDDPNKLVVAKVKNETNGVAIKEFVRLKPKMYLFGDVFICRWELKGCCKNRS